MEVNKEMVIQFIELQRRGLGLKKAEVNFDNCDWDLLIRHSYRNKTTMLINNAVNKERMNYDIDEHTLSDWNNLSRQLFFRGIRQLSRYKEIMKMLQDNDIKPVVLKGYALAQLYPDIIQRYSSDLDIKFDGEWNSLKDYPNKIFLRNKQRIWLTPGNFVWEVPEERISMPNWVCQSIKEIIEKFDNKR